MGLTTGYSREHRPLGSYALLATAFNAGLGAFVTARRDQLPERIAPYDLVLMGAATHKLSRLIAKDKVTSPLRAPFARYKGEAGPGEVSEEPRGSGLQLAIGEMLTCPYCLGQWVAAGLLAGLVEAPRTTRFVAALFAAHGVSDALQVVYKAGQEQL
jgi:Protein of unknown function (DUF1360)